MELSHKYALIWKSYFTFFFSLRQIYVCAIWHAFSKYTKTILQFWFHNHTSFRRHATENGIHFRNILYIIIPTLASFAKSLSHSYTYSYILYIQYILHIIVLNSVVGFFLFFFFFFFCENLLVYSSFRSFHYTITNGMSTL